MKRNELKLTPAEKARNTRRAKAAGSRLGMTILRINVENHDAALNNIANSKIKGVEPIYDSADLLKKATRFLTA